MSPSCTCCCKKDKLADSVYSVVLKDGGYSILSFFPEQPFEKNTERKKKKKKNTNKNNKTNLNILLLLQWEYAISIV
jgi:hypothetical protein